MRKTLIRTSVLFALAHLLAPAPAAAAYRALTGAAALQQKIERLRVTGSVLLIAAHPDDENTALLAWCAQARKLRTGYLSLTRGEGGQNLIGNEQGELLGVIRTQELLAARRVDGAEQFFTRAIDFGFSKTAAETLSKWGREQVLSDVVWVIRSFRPDVIILRFSGTPRDGHGHHQSSSLLGQEAFKLAADPKAFPEQLKSAQPWQARRLFWNGFSFTRQQEAELEKTPQRLMIDTGEYNPLLGLSYGEIAGLSRSQHRSQGMGSAERRGSAPNFLFLYGGEPARGDFMEGIDTSWRRLPGGAAVDDALAAALAAFAPESPEKAIPHLMNARRAMAAIHHPVARDKLADLDEAVAQAAGLWLSVQAAQPSAVPGGQAALTLTALNRSRAGVQLIDARLEGIAGAPVFQGAALEYNRPFTSKALLNVPASQPLTQPIQLREPRAGNLYSIADPRSIGPAEARPVLTARFRIAIGGGEIEVFRPVDYRYVDRVRGELTRPFIIVPAVAVSLPETPLVFTAPAPRAVPVELRAASAGQAGSVRLDAPPGWRVDPPESPFEIPDAGQAVTAVFQVTPPAAPARGVLRATAKGGGFEWRQAVTQVAYEHIPPQTVLRPASVTVLRDSIRVSARRVGYVMGAGDFVPEALKELGCEVTLLDSGELAEGDLSRFDAIVTGTRAWNVRNDLRANHQRLRDFMERGGTLVVQYNTLEGFMGDGDQPALRHIAPFPLRIGRNRTTVEEAPVKFLLPDHPLLNSPNRITAADFDGWVQERALYYPAEWDSRYEALLETADPGEPPQRGGLLFARVGRGAYVFTSFAWFRQLPAAVPGAYRILANLVSAGK